MRTRSHLLLVCGALALSACENVPLTREPDPPLHSADWFAIALATSLCGVALAAHLVRRFAARGAPSRARTVAGSAFAGGAVLALGGLSWFYVTAWRAAVILDWGECREPRLPDRPEQIVQLSCNTSFYDLTWFGLAYVTVALGVPALVLLLCARSLLVRTTRPIGPAVLATAITAGLGALTGSAVGEELSAPEWLALLAATAVAAAGAWCCWVEVARPPPPPGEGANRHPGREVGGNGAWVPSAPC